MIFSLSTALLYWDFEGFTNFEQGLSLAASIRQVWSLAMRLTMSVIWFSTISLVLFLLCRLERLAEFLGRLVILASGPNLLFLNLVGTAVGGIDTSSLCGTAMNPCHGIVPVVLCVSAWILLYVISGASSYILLLILASWWRRRKGIQDAKRSIKEPMKEVLMRRATDEQCPVCLDQYRKGDKALVLPNCRHQFHSQCIQHWLTQSRSCPVCRCEA